MATRLAIASRACASDSGGSQVSSTIACTSSAAPRNGTTAKSALPAPAGRDAVTARSGAAGGAGAYARARVHPRGLLAVPLGEALGRDGCGAFVECHRDEPAGEDRDREQQLRDRE